MKLKTVFARHRIVKILACASVLGVSTIAKADTTIECTNAADIAVVLAKTMQAPLLGADTDVPEITAMTTSGACRIITVTVDVAKKVEAMAVLPHPAGNVRLGVMKTESGFAIAHDFNPFDY